MTVPVELVAVTRLQPHPTNPNIGDIDAIRESIRANDWYGTIVADRRTGLILAGQHRWAAAKSEGIDQVPVYWVKTRDDAHATRIMLADNRTAQLAHYDDEKLAGLLGDLDTYTGTGWTTDDVDLLLAELEAKGRAGQIGFQAATGLVPILESAGEPHDFTTDLP